jgi:3-deoxy-D-manno-octulosonic-acid transferase
VWCAASTHPGEEAVVAATRVDGALCILAPRHPARGDEVEALLRAAGLSVTRRSRGEVPGGDVHLADTLGEMGLWFDLCPVTLVAGSLVDGIGGHNAYEPALHGSAILHGPHVGNFANLYARLDAAGAARVVRAPKDLADAVAALLRDAEARQGMVAAAGAVLAEEGDGVAQVAGLILGQMPN